MIIKYTLSVPEPHTHYAEVEMLISDINVKELNLKMAVWTPGSYLIREFQKNIDFITAEIRNQEPKRIEKTDKNTWKVITDNASEIKIKYRTYCFEYSVRTNFIDDTHAQLNGAATFLYIEGFENTPSEIEIIPFKEWKNISTSLIQKDNNKWLRVASDTDELIDSPIEIGNHISYFFDATNVSHEVAIYGKSNCNTEKLIADLKKIIETETKIFGSHPCKNYVFFIHNTDNSFGGLEHLHSSVNHVTRWSYDEKNYQKAISLLAHEYFHLWNIKRIIPSALIPFNYDAENYTELLWFFEGVTSYYDDYVCYRAGIITQEEFLEIVARNVNVVLNTAGTDTQTLAEASFDTWLKYYRKNENTNNIQISYYNKGAVVAMIFDFIILDVTNGEKCLDDVMKKLYSDYISNPAQGITENSLLDTFQFVSNFDFTSYFQKYIHSTESFSIETYFDLIGIDTKEEKSDEVYLGLTTSWKEGKLWITELDKNYGAYQSGLNVSDEIIAINGFRATKDFTGIYEHKKINDYIEVMVSRQGTIKTYTVALTPNRQRNVTFTVAEKKSPKQTALLNKWLQRNEN